MPLKGTKSAASESGWITLDVSGTNVVTYYRQAQFIANPGGNQSGSFGRSCAISNDANYIAIGAHTANGNGSQKGAVYIYSNVSNTFTLQTTLYQNTGANSSFFGFSVDLNDDGTYLVVGAPSANTLSTVVPKTYVYTRNGNSWTNIVTLDASQTKNTSEYGRSVAISNDGNYICVSAPEQKLGTNSAGILYFYTNNSNAWTEEANIFGANIAFYRLGLINIAINSDGSTVVADQESGTGNDTPVFTRSGNIWSQWGNISNSTIASPQRISMSGDANILIINGNVFYSKNTWTYTSTINDIGFQGQLSNNGTTYAAYTNRTVRIANGDQNLYSYLQEVIPIPLIPSQSGDIDIDSTGNTVLVTCNTGAYIIRKI